MKKRDKDLDCLHINVYVQAFECRRCDGICDLFVAILEGLATTLHSLDSSKYYPNIKTTDNMG